MSKPVFERRVDWSEWAQRADLRDCEAGCGQFQPNHPRRRFCGVGGCPGRKPSGSRRRRRPSGRAAAAARAAGIQGFLGEVLVEANRTGMAKPGKAMGDAYLEFVRAVHRGDREGARAAAVVMCAHGAASAVLLVPPAPDPPPP